MADRRENSPPCLPDKGSTTLISLPAELGMLLKLTRLDLSGTVTTSFINSSSLDILSSLTNLEVLDMGFCRVRGRLPTSMSRLSKLSELNFQVNELTGPIPNEILAPGLRRLDLQQNKFTGPLPPKLANLTDLTSLQLGSNKLTGPIPVGLGNLTSLRSVDLSKNNFTCPAPSDLLDLKTRVRTNKAKQCIVEGQRIPVGTQSCTIDLGNCDT